MIDLRKQFWGYHIWATAYFCGSVGTITNKISEDYIECDIDMLY